MPDSSAQPPREDSSASVPLRSKRSFARPFVKQIDPPRGLLAAPRCLYEYAAYYCAWLLFGAGSLLWSLPAALLGRLLPSRIGSSLGQYVIMAGFRPFVGFMKATGIIECDFRALDILRADRSLVIAPNHPSLLDAVLVISRLPRVVCIVKAPIWDNPFLGGGARLGGYLRNDAGLRLTKRAARAVSEGVPLLIFPEGTRTRDLPVDPFKGGFALIAQRAQAPIQTVFIECSSPFLSKSWPWYKKPAFPVVYRARLGRRFVVGADVRSFVTELQDYYREELGGSH
ncbi:MAG: lysophospholipid acyltransferase family protein [Burkholderiaceae bacterium]|jgi:1-acyl-sn-glycerol-3-phosphate acyltransferase